jgi:hypothetical protein
MLKVRIGKIIVISFIGLIVAFFAGLGGNFILQAGLPTSVPKTEFNFEKSLQILEDDLDKGTITKHKYDSLSAQLHIKMERRYLLQDESHNPDKMPEWVSKLGITEPDGMKFDPIFSNYTSIDDPSEGFNSVSLVYTGSYEQAIEQAEKIAVSAKLSAGRIFKAKGSPASKENVKPESSASYLNYSLGNTNQDYLISVQVEPSGRLTIMVTDNKQLNERLLAYEPLNNRQNSAAKRKKQ